MRLISPCSVTSSTSTKASVLVGSVGGRVLQARAVTCSAPNCTVSPIAASNEMVRPVILSRPAKIARPFSIFCVGVSVTTVSSGCGDVSAGCGGGGLAGAGVLRAAGGGACDAPGGGGNGCAWMPVDGRVTGFCGAGYCCGGEYCCPGYCTGGGCGGNAPLGTSAGGRGGESLKMVPNWASAGVTAKAAATTTNIAAIRPMNFVQASVGCVFATRSVNMLNTAKTGFGARPTGES